MTPLFFIILYNVIYNSLIPMINFSVISSIRRILSGCQRANDVMTRTDFIGCSCINCIYWRNLNGKY